MEGPKENPIENKEESKEKNQKKPDHTHLGSSNAFEKTENPLSRDADDISDEKLDELLGK